jgi:hypothetical protein
LRGTWSHLLESWMSRTCTIRDSLLPLWKCRTLKSLLSGLSLGINGCILIRAAWTGWLQLYRLTWSKIVQYFYSTSPLCARQCAGVPVLTINQLWSPFHYVAFSQ